MRITRIASDAIRSLNRVEFDPAPGVSVVIGPNGIGKTNLIEAVYFGLTTRSFRTSDRRDLIPFGSDWARSRVEVESAGVTHRFMSAIDRSEGLRFTLDGAPAERSEAARYRPAVTVFSPDRLELIKGPPALRRSHTDGFIAARWPHLAAVRREFGRTLAQRNALLGRIRDGGPGVNQLPSWDSQLARTAVLLSESRSDAVDELANRWVAAAADLGLEGELALVYRPGGPTSPTELEAALNDRHESDLRLGRTGIGPHHDEIRFELNRRQLRRFGSQGQQRLGLLALLFAERESLLASGRPAPLMLLDDVMSELDAARRRRLLDRLLAGGQTIITAAGGELVPDLAGVERFPMTELLDRSGERPRRQRSNDA